MSRQPSGSSQDLELDEEELWGQGTDRKGEGELSGSDSDSDDSSCSDEHISLQSSTCHHGTDGATGSGDGCDTSTHHRDSATTAPARPSSLFATAAAAEALAARHPGMKAGGDYSVSLTRAIPGGALKRRTLGGLGPWGPSKAEATLAAAKLGSSVPIAIPMASQPQEFHGGVSPPVRDAHAATFIPPHLLEQRAGGRDYSTSASIHGTSPAASLKRVRLVNRNVVLRSIGFLEEQNGGASGITETMDPIREAVNEGPFSSSPAAYSVSPSVNSFTGASGLSSALKSAKIGY